MWIVAGIFCAFLFSLASIMRKQVLKHEHTLPTLFWSTVAMAFTTLLFFNQIQFNVKPEIAAMLFWLAFFIALGWYTLFHAIRVSEISAVEPLMNLSPILVALFAFIFLGEHLGLIQYLGIAIIVFGTMILQFDIKRHALMMSFNRQTIYMGIAITAFSIAAILAKAILAHITVMTVLFYVFSTSAILYLIAIIARGYITDIFAPLKHTPYIVVGSAATQFSAEVVLHSLMALPIAVSLLIPIKRLSTVFSTIVGGTYFHEGKILQKGIACGVMFIGVICIAV